MSFHRNPQKLPFSASRPSPGRVGLLRAASQSFTRGMLCDNATDAACACSQPSCETTCNRCERQFIFILATGRSGSTSLMLALNALPQVHLRGELTPDERGILSTLHSVPWAAAHPQEEVDRVDHAHGAYDAERLLCDAQQLLIDLNPLPEGKTIGGLKELLCGRVMQRCGDWDGEQEERIAQAVRELLAVAPCSRVIFNIRLGVADQVASQIRWGWIQNDDDGDRARFLTALNRDILRVGDRFPDRVRVMPLESFSTSNFSQLAQWLGFPCTFSTVPNDDGPAALTCSPPSPSRPASEGFMPTPIPSPPSLPSFSPPPASLPPAPPLRPPIKDADVSLGPLALGLLFASLAANFVAWAWCVYQRRCRRPSRLADTPRDRNLTNTIRVVRSRRSHQQLVEAEKADDAEL